MCEDSFDLSPGIDSDADLKSRRTKLKRGKRLFELNRLQNALLCIKTEVFEQDDVISGILLTGSWHDACSVRDAIVFPLFQRLRVDGRKRFEYATYGRLFFRKQTEKNLRFKKYQDTCGRDLSLDIVSLVLIREFSS